MGSSRVRPRPRPRPRPAGGPARLDAGLALQLPRRGRGGPSGGRRVPE